MKPKNELITTHELDFLNAIHPVHGNMFKIGTCEGVWGSTPDCYYILFVGNKKPGNGHLTDVFEWFEFSCKRDNRNLIMLECMNKNFYMHLITKRGFQQMDAACTNAIKVFNPLGFEYLKKNGNKMIQPITLTCY